MARERYAAARQKNARGEVLIRLSETGPNPKQLRFLTADRRYVCYGGARGGGKTWSVIAKALSMAANPEYKGIRILIMRRKYTQLEEMLVAPMCRLTPPELGCYVASAHTLFFRNGSTIKFGFLNTRRDLDDYQGKEYDVVFIDEATQFSEEEFRTLGACLRGVNPFPKRFYLTCNPGGIGHQWVKRLFITRDYRRDPLHPENDENPDDYLFISATVYDNAVLLKHSPDYVRQLNLLPDKIRRAHRDGDWDALSGQYFSEFRSGIHTAEPFRIPEEWIRYRAIDYGLDMFACLWVAVDFEGRAWVYREYQQPGLIVSRAAETMAARTLPGERIEATIAPPDLWSTQKDTGRTMAEIFAENGSPLSRASGGRVQGWLVVREYLRPGQDGEPMLRISRECPRLIENLQALLADENNPGDCAAEPHEITHITDALRYFARFRTLRPAAEEPGEGLPEPRRTEYGELMTGGDADESYLEYTGLSPYVG